MLRLDRRNKVYAFFSSAYSSHCFCIRNDRKLLGIGRNLHGELSLDTKSIVNEFVEIPIENRVNRVKDIKVGENFSILQSNDNKLYSTGSNKEGCLCRGLPVHMDCYDFTLISGLGEILSFDCGKNHVVVCTRNKVFSCGSMKDYYGKPCHQGENQGRTFQLGRGVEIVFGEVKFPCDVKIKTVVCGGYHTFFVDKEGDIYACGWNSFGQITLEKSDILVPTKIDRFQKRIMRISTGLVHTFFVDIVGSIYRCGNGYKGQLANDSPATVVKLEEVPKRDLFKNNFVDVIGGKFNTSFLTTDGNVFGSGDYYSFGISTRINKNVRVDGVFVGMDCVYLISGNQIYRFRETMTKLTKINLLLMKDDDDKFNRKIMGNMKYRDLIIVCN